MNVVHTHMCAQREGVFGENLSHDPSGLSGASAITAGIKAAAVAWPRRTLCSENK